LSLSIKVLEKHSGTLSRTAVASLGGLITSETVGYTDLYCATSHVATGNPYWLLTGDEAQNTMELRYVTSVAATEGHWVYMTALLSTDAVGVDSLDLTIYGTTGGGAVVAQKLNPAAGTQYQVSGKFAITAGITGDIILAWACSDTAGINTKLMTVQNWTAIELTNEFGAFDEPDAADLDTFFAWRWADWTYKNEGLYNSFGDKYYYASKIASHGLEFNDVVNFTPDGFLGVLWSSVYVLNSDWIITACYAESWGDHGTAANTVSYWTKIDYTSRLRYTTLRMNMRNDIDGSVSLSFNGNSVWQPTLGMVMFIYDSTEALFCGVISRVNTTKLNSTNWKCDCEIVTIMDVLRWNNAKWGTVNLASGLSTRENIDFLLDHQVFSYGRCFWRGGVDTGNALSSLSKSAGLVLSVTPDRRICVLPQTTTPTNAPRNITDAVNPDAQNITYSEDISNYGNVISLDGGYETNATKAWGYYVANGAITDNIAGMESNKYLRLADNTITNGTDADAVALLMFNQHGKIIPGVFSFTTGDLDYRPGQKIEVDIASLGMTSAKTMNIDSVMIYDADGVNLLCNVSCSNRDSTDYAAEPNSGSENYMNGISTKVLNSVPAIVQAAGTFTPALEGGTTAGTWTWITQDGHYVLHCNMCYITIVLDPLSISGSPSGDLTLTGLPFASADYTQVVSVYTDGTDWGTSKTMIQLIIPPGSTTGTFTGLENDGIAATVDVGNVAETDEIVVFGWYQIKPDGSAPYSPPA
jgi:hypothetical protein